MKNPASPDPGCEWNDSPPRAGRVRTGRVRPSVSRPSAWWAACAALTVGLAAMAGCADSVVEVGGELSLTLDAPPSALLPDSVAVTYDARGRSLFGMVLQYGDGSVDTLNFQGAQSAGGQVKHKYEAAGDYQITGTVTDGVEGTETAQVTVTVRP